MNGITALPGFAVTVLVTVAISGQFAGGEWYQSMHQPAWKPPAIVMAMAWAVLYVLMAVAAWQVFSWLLNFSQWSLNGGGLG